VGFINAELKRLDGGQRPLGDYCGILDTLMMARKKHPGQRNSLDALCKRYNVNNSHRELHGALLDAEILADVYLAMTGGQADLLLDSDKAEEGVKREQLTHEAAMVRKTRPKLLVIPCDENELQAHEQRLEAISKASGGRCLWRQ
jgi:DNA polymerase-3 subunit epsilon